MFIWKRNYPDFLDHSSFSFNLVLIIKYSSMAPRFFFKETRVDVCKLKIYRYIIYRTFYFTGVPHLHFVLFVKMHFLQMVLQAIGALEWFCAVPAVVGLKLSFFKRLHHRKLCLSNKAVWNKKEIIFDNSQQALKNKSPIYIFGQSNWLILLRAIKLKRA